MTTATLCSSNLNPMFPCICEPLLKVPHSVVIDCICISQNNLRGGGSTYQGWPAHFGTMRQVNVANHVQVAIHHLPRVTITLLSPSKRGCTHVNLTRTNKDSRVTCHCSNLSRQPAVQHKLTFNRRLTEACLLDS